MLIFALHYTPFSEAAFEPQTPVLAELLISRRADFFVLYHPLGKTGSTWLVEYRNGKEFSKRRIRSFRSPDVARYVSDIIVGTSVCLSLTRREKPYFVGADPLNAVVGLILKSLHRVRKTVYYSIDYSPQRFSNVVLNRLYHFLDRLSMHRSDFVWNVSRRIVEVRHTMGLPDLRNLYLPNVPDATAVMKYSSNTRDKFKIITLGSLDDQQDYMGLIDAVSDVRRRYPAVTLTIVGTGRDSEKFMEHVRRNKFDDFVRFTGHLNHEDCLDQISRSGIGCALYTGHWNFNYFGDSVKCREYLAFGLPILTNDTHSTALEIRDSDAGIICQSTRTDYANGLERILDRYDYYATHAKILGALYEHSKEMALQNLATDS